MDSGKMKAGKLWSTGLKEQRSCELHGFCFCFIQVARPGAGEVGNPESSRRQKKP